MGKNCCIWVIGIIMLILIPVPVAPPIVPPGGDDMKIGQFETLDGVSSLLTTNQNIRNVGQVDAKTYWSRIVDSPNRYQVHSVVSLTDTPTEEFSGLFAAIDIANVNMVLRSFGATITAVMAYPEANGVWLYWVYSDDGESWPTFLRIITEVVDIYNVRIVDVYKTGSTHYAVYSYEIEDGGGSAHRYAIYSLTSSTRYVYGTDLTSYQSIYGGKVLSNGDYELILYNESGDFEKVLFNESAKTFSSEVVTGLIAPSNWDVEHQQYWRQGKTEIIMDEDHLYSRLIGGEWTSYSDTGTTTNGIVWGYDGDGNYVIKFIIWKDSIYVIAGGGKLGKLQTFTDGAYVGIDDWFSNGVDKIYQLIPTNEKDGEIITFTKGNVITANYKAPSGSFSSESENAIWNERDIVMIYDDAFTVNDDLVLVGSITVPEGFEGDVNEIKVTNFIDEDLARKVDIFFPSGTYPHEIIEMVIPTYCGSLSLGIINQTDSAITFDIAFKKDVKDVLSFCDEYAKLQGRINPDWSYDWDNGEAATGIVLTDNNNINLVPKPDKVKVTAVNVVGGINISTGKRVNITVTDDTEMAGISITKYNTSLVTDAAAIAFGNNILGSLTYTIQNYKSNAWDIEIPQVGLRLSMASAQRGLSAANYHINYCKRDLINGKNHLIYSNVRQYLIDPDEERPSASIENEQMIEDNAIETDVAKFGPAGFVNRTDSTISMSTSTFQITGTYIVYCNNVRYEKTGDSVDMSAFADGLWFFYYNASEGVITYSQTPWVITAGYALIATVYKNSNSYLLLAEERHVTPRDLWWHRWAHDTIRARYENDGGLAAVFDVDDAEITSGTIHDEDIEIEITGADPYQFSVFYRNGTLKWVWTAAQSAYYHDVSNIVQWDDSGTLTDVNNASHVAYWIYATNHLNTPQIISVMGQRQDTTLANAKINNTPQGLALGDLPSAEWVLLYRVILKRVGTSVSVEDTLDLRTKGFTGTGSSTLTNHGALSGLQNDDHFEIYYNKTDIDALWAIGSGNAVWINCPFFGVTDIAAYSSSVTMFRNTGATDYSVEAQIPGPYNKNGLSLRVNRIRIGVADSDSSDYLDLVRVFIYSDHDSSTTPISVDHNVVNGTGIGTFIYDSGDDGSFPVDLSGIHNAIIYLNLVCTSLNQIEIAWVEVEVYYA